MERSKPLVLDLATHTEIDAVLSTIHALSRWLKSKGIHQWSDSFTREMLETEVVRGELFVLGRPEVFASVVLSDDPGNLWDRDSDDVLYLHRLAVARNRAGERLGEAIMAWAENQARQMGKASLRLVCDANNPFLPGYYLKLGYEPRDSKYYEPWQMTFARFEKPL